MILHSLIYVHVSEDVICQIRICEALSHDEPSSSTIFFLFSIDTDFICRNFVVNQKKKQLGET